jgi:hypothetical protein
MSGQARGADMSGQKQGADRSGQKRRADRSGQERRADWSGQEQGADWSGQKQGASMSDTDTIGTLWADQARAWSWSAAGRAQGTVVSVRLPVSRSWTT